MEHVLLTNLRGFFEAECFFDNDKCLTDIKPKAELKA